MDFDNNHPIHQVIPNRLMYHDAVAQACLLRILFSYPNPLSPILYAQPTYLLPPRLWNAYCALPPTTSVNLPLPSPPPPTISSSSSSPRSPSPPPTPPGPPPPTPPPTPPPPSLSITLYPPIATPPSAPTSGGAISSLQRTLGHLDAAVTFLRLSADGTALFGSTAARRTEYSTARHFAGGSGVGGRSTGGDVDARVVRGEDELLVELLADLVRQVWEGFKVVERIFWGEEEEEEEEGEDEDEGEDEQR